MKKLRKTGVRANSVEAYACACKSCSCSRCFCSCMGSTAYATLYSAASSNQVSADYGGDTSANSYVK